MASDEKITQLETVYGSLKPHQTYGAVRAASGPFTGRDLLDATYGYGERFPAIVSRCRCGAMLVAHDPRTAAECGQCRTDPLRGLRLVLEEDLPAEFTARLGNARYAWFAELWWRLDEFGDRVRPIRKRSKVEKLDRLSGRRVPTPKAERAEKPYTLIWEKRTDGTLRQAKTYQPASCQCEDEESHDAYYTSLAGSICPIHGTECATCGADHFHEDSE